MKPLPFRTEGKDRPASCPSQRSGAEVSLRPAQLPRSTGLRPPSKITSNKYDHRNHAKHCQTSASGEAASPAAGGGGPAARRGRITRAAAAASHGVDSGSSEDELPADRIRHKPRRRKPPKPRAKQASLPVSTNVTQRLVERSPGPKPGQKDQTGETKESANPPRRLTFGRKGNKAPHQDQPLVEVITMETKNNLASSAEVKCTKVNKDMQVLPGATVQTEDDGAKKTKNDNSESKASPGTHLGRPVKPGSFIPLVGRRPPKGLPKSCSSSARVKPTSSTEQDQQLERNIATKTGSGALESAQSSVMTVSPGLKSVESTASMGTGPRVGVGTQNSSDMDKEIQSTRALVAKSNEPLCAELQSDGEIRPNASSRVGRGGSGETGNKERSAAPDTSHQSQSVAVIRGPVTREGDLALAPRARGHSSTSDCNQRDGGTSGAQLDGFTAVRLEKQQKESNSTRDVPIGGEQLTSGTAATCSHTAAPRTMEEGPAADPCADLVRGTNHSPPRCDKTPEKGGNANDNVKKCVKSQMTVPAARRDNAARAHDCAATADKGSNNRGPGDPARPDSDVTDAAAVTEGAVLDSDTRRGVQGASLQGSSDSELRLRALSTETTPVPRPASDAPDSSETVNSAKKSQLQRFTSACITGPDSAGNSVALGERSGNSCAESGERGTGTDIDHAANNSVSEGSQRGEGGVGRGTSPGGSRGQTAPASEHDELPSGPRGSEALSSCGQRSEGNAFLKDAKALHLTAVSPTGCCPASLQSAGAHAACSDNVLLPGNTAGHMIRSNEQLPNESCQFTAQQKHVKQTKTQSMTTSPSAASPECRTNDSQASHHDPLRLFEPNVETTQSCASSKNNRTLTTLVTSGNQITQPFPTNADVNGQSGFPQDAFKDPAASCHDYLPTRNGKHTATIIESGGDATARESRAIRQSPPEISKVIPDPSFKAAGSTETRAENLTRESLEDPTDTRCEQVPIDCLIQQSSKDTDRSRRGRDSAGREGSRGGVVSETVIESEMGSHNTAPPPASSRPGPADLGPRRHDAGAVTAQPPRDESARLIGCGGSSSKRSSPVVTSRTSVSDPSPGRTGVSNTATGIQPHPNVCDNSVSGPKLASGSADTADSLGRVESGGDEDKKARSLALRGAGCPQLMEEKNIDASLCDDAPVGVTLLSGRENICGRHQRACQSAETTQDQNIKSLCDSAASPLLDLTKCVSSSGVNVNLIKGADATTPSSPSCISCTDSGFGQSLTESDTTIGWENSMHTSEASTTAGTMIGAKFEVEGPSAATALEAKKSALPESCTDSGIAPEIEALEECGESVTTCHNKAERSIQAVPNTCHNTARAVHTITERIQGCRAKNTPGTNIDTGVCRDTELDAMNDVSQAQTADVPTLHNEESRVDNGTTGTGVVPKYREVSECAQVTDVNATDDLPTSSRALRIDPETESGSKLEEVAKAGDSNRSCFFLSDADEYSHADKYLSQDTGHYERTCEDSLEGMEPGLGEIASNLSDFEDFVVEEGSKTCSLSSGSRGFKKNVEESDSDGDSLKRKSSCGRLRDATEAPPARDAEKVPARSASSPSFTRRDPEKRKAKYGIASFLMEGAPLHRAAATEALNVAAEEAARSPGAASPDTENLVLQFPKMADTSVSQTSLHTSYYEDSNEYLNMLNCLQGTGLRRDKSDPGHILDVGHADLTVNNVEMQRQQRAEMDELLSNIEQFTNVNNNHVASSPDITSADPDAETGSAMTESLDSPMVGEEPESRSLTSDLTGSVSDTMMVSSTCSSASSSQMEVENIESDTSCNESVKSLATTPTNETRPFPLPEPCAGTQTGRKIQKMKDSPKGSEQRKIPRLSKIPKPGATNESHKMKTNSKLTSGSGVVSASPGGASGAAPALPAALSYSAPATVDVSERKWIADGATSPRIDEGYGTLQSSAKKEQKVSFVCLLF